MKMTPELWKSLTTNERLALVFKNRPDLNTPAWEAFVNGVVVMSGWTKLRAANRRFILTLRAA